MTVLHEFALSSASYRVRIALNMKGIAYESRSYRLRAGEQRSDAYRSLNPALLVPTLEIDGLTLTQSTAIIDYLETTRPLPALLPRDPHKRAQVLAIAMTIACDIHPLNNLRVLGYLAEKMDQNEARVNDWYRHWVEIGFDAIEAMLKQSGEGPFVNGDQPGLAEICLVPQLYNARRFDVPLSRYPRLVEISDRAAELPAFAAAYPAIPG